MNPTAPDSFDGRYFGVLHMADVIGRLCAPVLRPVQRVIPLIGGLDLSPLVLLVLLQIAMIVLGHLQAAALTGVLRF